MIQLSYSANNRYQISPRAYYLYYILRLRPKYVSSALLFGGAVDTALNSLLKNKMEGKKVEDAHSIFNREWTKQRVNGELVDLRKTDLVSYFKSDYDEFILDQKDKDAIESGINPNWVSLNKKGHMIIDAYEAQVIPEIQEVIGIQKYIKLTNETGDKFIGWADFIARFNDGNVYIGDNKTASRKYKDDSASESPQLATYFEGAKEDDIFADGVVYIVAPKKFRKIKEPKVPMQIVKGKISEDLLNKTFQEYDNTLHGIKMGEFPCTGCGDNPFGCDYKRYCESDGKDMTGLVYVKKSKN